MNKTAPPSHISGEKEALLSNVALLYYGEGLTQGEIAKRMKVSRATIVNMLRESRELGVVEIRVDGHYLTGSSLARDLREKFGLVDVYVAQPASDEVPLGRTEALAQLARVAAMALLDVVEPGDRLGVAWGETIMAVADTMPRNAVADVEVCQLIGSMISDRVPASENCTIQIANKLGAQCYTLHAPGLISNAELALQIREEPTIRMQLDRLKALDMAIYSVGNVHPETHLVAADMASEKTLADAVGAGAAGILCCRYLSAAGEQIDMPPHDRLIAATLGDLRNARKKLLVVCGRDRAEATLASIRGGLATHLVVDKALALELMND
ncbi:MULTISPECIES: sugar-binding transcriptional regulator [unclassified Mameliella]|uniref:sugar-binding transcriptional regulator n=1 Tax=unclassified Mameliella TaxID=2630630 RepID=UPI00273FFBF5|nr:MULTISPECIES: sugar-binding domain-containing protein [unclassified Mameliella]